MYSSSNDNFPFTKHLVPGFFYFTIYFTSGNYLPLAGNFTSRKSFSLDISHPGEPFRESEGEKERGVESNQYM